MKKWIINWLFKKQLKEIEETLQCAKTELRLIQDKQKQVNNLLGNIDVSVDVHMHSSSWACISIQGERSDYIKFVDLGTSDIREIERFLKRYERNQNPHKIDSPPSMKRWLKMK